MYGRRYKVRTPVTTNDNFSLFYLSFIAQQLRRIIPGTIYGQVFSVSFLVSHLRGLQAFRL